MLCFVQRDLLLPVATPWRYWMATLGAGVLGPLWVPLGASIVYAPWSPFRANVHHFLDPVLPHFYTQGFSPNSYVEVISPRTPEYDCL